MDDAERWTGRDRALAWAAPLLLVAVAALAIARYHVVHQSSWQGFGFGMFATHEYEMSRTVRITALVDGVETTVDVPADLRRLESKVLVAPGDPEATALADALRADLGADRIVLEVWGHDVDEEGDALRIGFRMLRRVAVP